MLPEFFTLRNWTRFCLYINNQYSYGQMDGTGGFRASNWSKDNSPRCSDCRLLMLYKVVKELWAEFFASDFGDVPANLATTSRTTDKWIVRLDSAGQKGPEMTLEGILIIVEGCFTAERTCGSGLTKTHCHQWLLSFSGLEPCWAKHGRVRSNTNGDESTPGSCPPLGVAVLPLCVCTY